MNNEIKNETEIYKEDGAEHEKVEHSVDHNQELQTMLDELCTELEGVIPEQIFEIIKQVQPLEAAIKLLWEYGGSIRINNPEVDLKKDYSYPAEVNELNDEVGAFSFTIAKSPFMALAGAASAGINANEEVIQSCDLEGYVPIIITESKKVKRICLVNYEERRLDVTTGFGLSLNIDMSGDSTEQEAALAKGTKELENYLDELKQQIDDLPELFDSKEEEDAITTWCKKHSYTILGVIRSSTDIYF